MKMRSTKMALTCVAVALTSVATLSGAADGARAGGTAGSHVTVSKGPAVALPKSPAQRYGRASCSKTRPDLCNTPKGGSKAGSTYTPPSPRPGSGKSSNCQPNGEGCTKQF